MENTRTDFYVYCHQRKDNGKCFYIGKGTGRRYKSDKNRNRHWHFVVDKYGFTPVILVSGLTEEQAWGLEASFVEQIGVENLANCDVPKAWGGHSKSEESKAKLGNSMRGKTWEIKGRISPPHSEETKAKMSASATGKPKSEEHKAKMSAAKKGVPKPERNKPVLQYDLQGNFMQEFESITIAAKSLNRNTSDIATVCRNKQKTAYGFIWKFKN